MRSIVVNNYICCPIDKSYPLGVEEAVWDAQELLSGTLRCPTCGIGYPVTEGIARFIPPSEVMSDDLAWEAKLREARARDNDSPVYDASLTAYETQAELSMFERTMRLKPADVVLDLGAGTGRLSTILAATGAHVLAVDISYDSLKLNRTRCSALPGAVVDHVTADVCHLPFRDGIANGAGSGMLLEHIPTDVERHRFTAEIHRVLAAGGSFALTAYNYSWAKRRQGDREGYHGGGLYYHRLYRDELRELLSCYRIRTVTGIHSKPGRLLQSVFLDRLISRFPPVATITGNLLFAVAERGA
ncbi:MAG: methyltransferase domain-containing protein [Chloroflexi bacterium]|nr:methyltransferase domain-containing protein [Chloroflexota bacterium]